MAVRPEQLDHPERDLDLATRETQGAGRQRRESADTELKALRARIAEARTLQPSPEQRHCVDCFERGRNAAIRVIEGTDR